MAKSISKRSNYYRSKHLFPFEWTLKDAIFTKDKGKVFSCFACGGGSTMGYKLAGFDVLGCNEIDPKMMKAYVTNHNPKYSFLQPIQEFKNSTEIPDELYHLDILDGSPPCSSFSMAGSREKAWGDEKKFREGQAKQVLDTLFFDFVDLAEKLKPKVVVAENVKGLLMGNAKKYVERIHIAFRNAGYCVFHKLLDASNMGVPQRRERVFFIGIRMDLIPKVESNLFFNDANIDLIFKEKKIPFSQIRCEKGNASAYQMGPLTEKYWELTPPGYSFSLNHPKGHFFNDSKTHPDHVLPTITGSKTPHDYIEKRVLFDEEIIKAGTFPLDYNFCDNKPNYLVGMSVPPVMTAQIATKIYNQWLVKLR